MWRHQQSQLAVRFEHYLTANIAPPCQSFEFKMEPQVPRTKYCRNCKNRIHHLHFEVHQERCRPPINVIKPSPSRLKKQEKKKEQPSQPQQEEFFPCHLCGFKRTLKDLDTHQYKCMNAQVECSNCQVSFPKNLMIDHKHHCSRQAISSEASRNRFEMARISAQPSRPISSNTSEQERMRKVEIRPLPREQSLLQQNQQLNREERPVNTSVMISSTIPQPRPTQERVQPSLPSRSRELHQRGSDSEQNEGSETNLHFPHLNRQRAERPINRPIRYEQMRLLLAIEGRQQQNELIRLHQQSQQLIQRALNERNRQRLIRQRNVAINLREEQLRLEEAEIRALTLERERKRQLEEQLRVMVANRNQQRERLRANEQIRLLAEQRRRRLEVEAAAQLELRNQARLQLNIERLASRRNNNNKSDRLTSADLKKIKNIKYKKTSKQQETCSICCNQLLQKQLIKDLPCKHLYHVECISKWLMINKTCPLCKSDISEVVKLIKEEENKRKMAKKAKSASAVIPKQPVTQSTGSSQSVSRSIDWLSQDVQEADLNYIEDEDEERGLIMRDRR